MRITKEQYEAALSKRYRDLRDLVRADARVDNRFIEHDDIRIVEMRAVKRALKAFKMGIGG